MILKVWWIYRPNHFIFFKGYLPQILFSPFLNTLTQLLVKVKDTSKTFRTLPNICDGFRKKKQLMAFSRSLFSQKSSIIYVRQGPENTSESVLKFWTLFQLLCQTWVKYTIDRVFGCLYTRLITQVWTAARKLDKSFCFSND